jgi:hypothetical protein
VAVAVAVRFLVLLLETVQAVVLEVALVTPEEPERLDQELLAKVMLVGWERMEQ